LVAAAVALVAPAPLLRLPVRPLPSLAICWSPPPSRLSPLRLSWRLPFEPVPLVCRFLVALPLCSTPSPPSCRLPFAPAPLSCARLFYHFSSTKRKENRGAAMQDTQVAIRIEQQTTHNIDPRITRSMRSKLKSRCTLCERQNRYPPKRDPTLYVRKVE
jgi:hypothetical protein